MAVSLDQELRKIAALSPEAIQQLKNEYSICAAPNKTIGEFVLKVKGVLNNG